MVEKLSTIELSWLPDGTLHQNILGCAGDRNSLIEIAQKLIILEIDKIKSISLYTENAEHRLMSNSTY